MSLIEFRDRFEEKIHGFLWKQWSALGVAGTAAGEARWILDPEALLLFTLESARSEPRLFDEVLDWLVKNGERIDVQRLRNLADEDKEYPVALLNAVASMLAEHETSAKWSRLARFVPDPAAKRVPLIQLRSDAAMPKLRSHDPHFERAGFLRSPFEAREMSQPIAMQAGPCARFRLRAFFGIGIRAEAVLYLLTHPESHADDVARAIGYSFPGVQQVLREMGESGLVQARRAGREKRYWVEKERWSEFLDLKFVDTQQLAIRSEAARRLIRSGAEEKARELSLPELEVRRRAAEELLKREEAPEQLTPMELEARRQAALQLLRPEVAWINWSRLYRGLARILRQFRQPDSDRASEYVQSSEFARTAESAKNDLEASESGFHLPSHEGGSLDAHVMALQRALDRLVE